MAKKFALGRGLGSLISAGAPATDSSSKKNPPKTKKKKKHVEEPKLVEVSKPAVSKPVKKAIVTKTGLIPVPSKGRAIEIDAPGLREKPKAAAPKPDPVAPEPAPAPKLTEEVPLTAVVPNPHQPRKSFDETALKELADSIRSEGLLQPIVVRKVGDKFELIAGERRWRACQLLKLRTIPVRVVQASETSSAVLSLIENLQREDLNPIEESMGYAALIKDFGLTQEQVAERVGRNRASVANMLRLLQLPSEIRGFLAKGHISTGHAKVLLGLDSQETQIILARQVIEQGWSVRETERQIERAKQSRDTTPGTRPPVSAAEQTAISDLQNRLASSLGTPVSLKHAPRRGKIIIEYFGNDDLQRIIDRMGL